MGFCSPAVAEKDVTCAELGPTTASCSSPSRPRSTRTSSPPGGIDEGRPADRRARRRPGRLRPAHRARAAHPANRATGRYVAIDPVHGPVPHRRAARARRAPGCCDESSSWADAFAPARPGVAARARHRARTVHDPPRHGARIDPFIAGLVAECEEEMLTAQPQTGRDAETLAAAAVRDTAMLERGTRMRTLYQHSARRSAITARLRRRRHRPRRRGAHARRVLQPDDRLRPPDRGDPRQAGGPRTPRSRSASRRSSTTSSTSSSGPGSAAGRSPAARPGCCGHRRRAAGDDDPDADRGPRRPGQRQAARRQPPHLRRLRRRPQARVRGGDPLPARLHDGAARGLRPRARPRAEPTEPRAAAASKSARGQ